MRPVTTENIPDDILDLLDERAGKRHSREGPVVRSLVEILNLYGERLEEELREARELLDAYIEDVAELDPEGERPNLERAYSWLVRYEYAHR